MNQIRSERVILRPREASTSLSPTSNRRPMEGRPNLDSQNRSQENRPQNQTLPTQPDSPTKHAESVSPTGGQSSTTNDGSAANCYKLIFQNEIPLSASNQASADNREKSKQQPLNPPPLLPRNRPTRFAHIHPTMDFQGA